MDAEHSIKETIRYFDIFDFSLTDWEIYKNLWQPARSFAFKEIQAALARIVEKAEIGTREGFFFLKRRQDLVAARKKRYLLAQKKMKKARFCARLISWLPFVRAVFVCNDLAYFNAPLESDIDFAIITARERIWTARFLSAGLMALLRQRPTPESRADKICLSFYCSEEELNLRPLAYADDIHFVYWLSQFVPLSGEKGIMEKFYFGNQWLREYLPNLVFPSAPRHWKITRRPVFKSVLEKLLSGLAGNFLEKLLKKIQLKILPARLAALAREDGTDVVVSNSVLKLHDQDTRQAVRKKWEQKCSAGA
ncbi:hypothetical protein HZB94_02075 [Candidatus Falkowbacteria bacterium]|nr:hypothetical protein [Candidatus Falkowbacteria bacterium]